MTTGRINQVATFLCEHVTWHKADYPKDRSSDRPARSPQAPKDTKGKASSISLSIDPSELPTMAYCTRHIDWYVFPLLTIWIAIDRTHRAKDSCAFKRTRSSMPFHSFSAQGHVLEGDGLAEPPRLVHKSNEERANTLDG